MDPLRVALDMFEPADETEARDVARLRALTGADPWSRTHPLHATASAIVVHPGTGRLLLRWHPRLDGWFQVGGHGDPGESDPWEIAHREAREETGLVDLTALTPALDRRPVQVVVVAVPAAGDEAAHEHADIRYAFATRSPDAVRAESAAAALRWFTFADARATITEPNLLVLIDRVERASSTAA